MSLADFIILNKLGEGSYSSVHKVKRLSDGKEYALKKVRLMTLKDKEKQNSLNEVRILASINNSYIISYKDAFIDENSNTLCIIMQYANGGDLQKKIQALNKKNLHFEQTEIWKIINNILNGLRILHQMKILHRDLKSANIFIVNGVYKLGDLNVSKILKKGLAYTQTGTPYYASPEVWRDQPYDSKSDIWSLGCVIYEMCALRPPFHAKNMEGLYKKVQKGTFDRIPVIYSEELQRFIESCLQLNYFKRPTCQQLLNWPRFSHMDNDSGDFSVSNNLMNTIKIPRNLGNLNELLPKSKYETMSNKYDTQRLSSRKSEASYLRNRESSLKKQLKKIHSQQNLLPLELKLQQQQLLQNQKSQQLLHKQKYNDYYLRDIIQKNNIVEIKSQQQKSGRNIQKEKQQPKGPMKKNYLYKVNDPDNKNIYQLNQPIFLRGDSAQRDIFKLPSINRLKSNRDNNSNSIGQSPSIKTSNTNKLQIGGHMSPNNNNYEHFRPSWWG